MSARETPRPARPPGAARVAARSKRRRSPPVTLTCIECGETSEEGEGWKGELAIDLLDEEEPDEVAVYCPECG